jgi:hypothetical protein
MGTKLKSSNLEIELTRFYGGEVRGTCIHLDLEGCRGQLRRDQAIKLAQDLLTFVEENHKDKYHEEVKAQDKYREAHEEAKALQDQEDWDQDREDLVQEAHYFTYYTGGARQMTKQEAIELLEATRQKIVSQGRIVDARLLDKERKLEQLIADWDKDDGGMDEARHTKPETA